MNITKERMLLYAVTADSSAQQVEEALLGGATLIQLREKRLSGEALLRKAREVKAVCDRFQIPLIINDNVELALACDAAGVHLGQKDLPAKQARAMLGEGKIIGVTARTVELAKQAERDGADYIGSGAVFATSTKKDAVLLEHRVLRGICDSVSIPVVAIGGIDEENITQLQGTHIAGVAVVSSVFGAEDVRLATQKLKRLARETVEG